MCTHLKQIDEHQWQTNEVEEVGNGGERYEGLEGANHHVTQEQRAHHQHVQPLVDGHDVPVLHHLGGRNKTHVLGL